MPEWGTVRGRPYEAAKTSFGRLPTKEQSRDFIVKVNALDILLWLETPVGGTTERPIWRERFSTKDVLIELLRIREEDINERMIRFVCASIYSIRGIGKPSTKTMLTRWNQPVFTRAILVAGSPMAATQDFRGRPLTCVDPNGCVPDRLFGAKGFTYSKSMMERGPDEFRASVLARMDEPAAPIEYDLRDLL